MTNPLLDGSEIISEMGDAARLYSGEDSHSPTILAVSSWVQVALMSQHDLRRDDAGV